MEQDLTILNKQAIAAAQKRMGKVAWLTVALVATVMVLFASTLWLAYHALLPLWALALLFAATTYMSYTPVHEAAHGNINGKNDKLKWLNDLCGYLCAPIIMVPYSTHKVEHFTHHRYTNQADKDPDFVVSEMGNGLRGFLFTIFKFLWVQNTFLFKDYWATASRKEKATYFAEVGLSIGWRVVALSILPLSAGLAVVIGGYLMGGIFTAYWFAYRPHHPYDNANRYQNTSSLIMPRLLKPIEWFWLGQNLHSIHHLFPRVPFYRYHDLHREIEPILRAHGTPIIGLYSRKPVAASEAPQHKAPAIQA